MAALSELLLVLAPTFCASHARLAADQACFNPPGTTFSLGRICSWLPRRLVLALEVTQLPTNPIGYPGEPSHPFFPAKKEEPRPTHLLGTDGSEKHAAILQQATATFKKRSSMNGLDPGSTQLDVLASLADLIPSLLDTGNPVGIAPDRKGSEVRFRHNFLRPE